jgi:hypothetical protein
VTTGYSPLPPTGTPIIDPGARATPSFGRWLAFVDRFITAPSRQFVASSDVLGNFANDAAAAAGGVVIGQFYRNGSVVQIRVT